MKNYELSNYQKISTPYIFVILQGTHFTHVPRQYLGQIFPWKIIVYRGIRFTITQHLFSTISVLNLKHSGQGTGYGERKEKKILNYRLCLHKFVEMWILRIWSPQIPVGSNLLAQIWVINSKRKNYSWKLQLENENQRIPLFIPSFYLCVLTECILVFTSKFKYNYYAY